MLEYLKLCQFAGKSVYCNCDTEKSEIYKLAKANFKTWQLKSLVATSYVKGGKGVKVVCDGETETISQLEGDGSYDSAESTEILEHSDIVITNPPFSKLGKFIQFVLERNKDFVIITNMMALMYKSVIKYSLAGKNKRLRQISRWCRIYKTKWRYSKSTLYCSDNIRCI